MCENNLASELNKNLLAGQIWKKNNEKLLSNCSLRFILGMTGTGKTTLLNFITGCSMKKIKTKTGQAFEVESVEKGKSEFAINHSKSETSLPNIYEGWVDCGGLEDTRGPEICISNQCLIRDLILQSKKSSFIFVAKYGDINYARDKGLKIFFDYVEKIFGSKEEAKAKRNSFILLVTHIPAENDLEEIKNKIEEVDQELGLFKNRVHTYDPLKKSDRDRLLKLFESLEGVKLENTQIKITADNFNTISDSLEQTLDLIKHEFEKFNFYDENKLNNIKDYLGCVKILGSLNSSEIKKKQKWFFQGFVLRFKNEIQKKLKNMIKSGDFDKIEGFIQYLKSTIEEWEFILDIDPSELFDFIDDLFEEFIDMRETQEEKEFLRSECEKTKKELNHLYEQNKNCEFQIKKQHENIKMLSSANIENQKVLESLKIENAQKSYEMNKLLNSQQDTENKIKFLENKNSELMDQNKILASKIDSSSGENNSSSKKFEWMPIVLGGVLSALSFGKIFSKK